MTPETADVGGWFRTAKDGVTLSSGAWCPSTGGHGRVSEGPDLAAGLDLFRGRPTMVLTGAGMSTGSGLPDYRGPDAVPRSPMTFQEFVGSDLSRRRYWARSTVAAANALLDDADALLVLGTSLTVMSGLRFVRRGVREGREVVILNDGATRGDDLASLRLHGRLEEVLGAWARITAAHPPRTTEPLRAVDSARSPAREVPHGRRTGSTP